MNFDDLHGLLLGAFWGAAASTVASMVIAIISLRIIKQRNTANTEGSSTSDRAHQSV